MKKEHWSYEKHQRFSKSGTRWHFAICESLEEEIPYDERPYELYFRNDDSTQFGVLRFERRKDNPYRDYEMVVNKIMNKEEFRETLLDSETSTIWMKSWK